MLALSPDKTRLDRNPLEVELEATPSSVTLRIISRLMANSKMGTNLMTTF